MYLSYSLSMQRMVCAPRVPCTPSSQGDEAHVLDMCLRRSVGLFVRLFVSSVAMDDRTGSGSWTRHGMMGMEVRYINIEMEIDMIGRWTC